MRFKSSLAAAFLAVAMVPFVASEAHAQSAHHGHNSVSVGVGYHKNSGYGHNRSGVSVHIDFSTGASHHGRYGYGSNRGHYGYGSHRGYGNGHYGYGNRHGYGRYDSRHCEPRSEYRYRDTYEQRYYHRTYTR